jgi:hypothetical protein
MQPIDFAKAAGLALLVLILDLACAFAFVLFWSLAIDPGHPSSYYTAAAPRLSTISTRVCGPLLLALFVWLFSRKRADRQPFAFAATVLAVYFFLDGAMVAFRPFFFTTPMLFTMGLKLMGALGGAALATMGHEKMSQGRE